MSYLIACDDGHGALTPGKRTPLFDNGSFIHENQFNKEACKYFMKEMIRCGQRVIETAEGDKDITLKERVKIANTSKADLFVSFHFNAFNGVWDKTQGGISTYYFTNSGKGRKLAEMVQSELIDGTSQVNRGIHTATFYVLKYTNMTAILIEAGFMDVRKEANLMLNVDFQKEVARETAKGVCKYLGIPYIEESKSYTVLKGDTLYGISKKLNIGVRELAKLNNITDINLIHVGQVLKY